MRPLQYISKSHQSVIADRGNFDLRIKTHQMRNAWNTRQHLPTRPEMLTCTLDAKMCSRCIIMVWLWAGRRMPSRHHLSHNSPALLSNFSQLPIQEESLIVHNYLSILWHTFLITCRIHVWNSSVQLGDYCLVWLWYAPCVLGIISKALPQTRLPINAPLNQLNSFPQSHGCWI